MFKVTNKVECGSLGAVTSTHFGGEMWATGSFDPAMGRFPTFHALCPTTGKQWSFMRKAEALRFAECRDKAALEAAETEDASRFNSWKAHTGDFPRFSN